jgi:acyl-CoA reductase-like NAD-dependent aldehyde dehydrogenase
MAFTCRRQNQGLTNLYIKKGAKKAGVTIIPGRGSVLTEALPGNKDRGACFFAGSAAVAVKFMAISRHHHAWLSRPLKPVT